VRGAAGPRRLPSVLVALVAVATTACGETPAGEPNPPWRGEVVRDGVEGLLVPPGDASALRDALGRLRQRSERTRFASHARRRARDFHWTSIAPHLENLLTGDDVALEQRER